MPQRNMVPKPVVVRGVPVVFQVRPEELSSETFGERLANAAAAQEHLRQWQKCGSFVENEAAHGWSWQRILLLCGFGLAFVMLLLL